MTVGIVGAGAAGLIAAKTLRDEGVDVTVFEAQDGPGGVYRRCYAGAQLTSSSVWTSFSCYPPRLAFEDGIGDGDASRPVHWMVTEYLVYLEAFVARFDLAPALRLSTRVERCRWTDGGWTLTTSGASPGEHRVDHLLVCSGVHQRGAVPELRGRDAFAGEVVHMAGCREIAALCRGRRVVVVGGGESAADIALQALDAADACALSVRGTGHVTPRSLGDARRTRELERDGALPLDTDIGIANLGVSPRLAGLMSWKDTVGLGLSALLPPFRVAAPAMAVNLRRGSYISCAYGTKSAGYAQAVLDGCVPKPPIERLDESGVVFVDGSHFPCDLVLLCTGFEHGFAFLDEADHPPAGPSGGPSSRMLYKHMLPPGQGLRLAFLGFVRPAFGTIPGLAEIQARYYAALISGRAELPSDDVMGAQIAADARFEEERFFSGPRLPALTDFLWYLDEVAELAGLRPTHRELLRTDPRLFVRGLLCQVSAHRYWLTDPGSHGDTARETLRRQVVARTTLIDLHLFVLSAWVSTLGWTRIRPTTVRPEGARGRALAWLTAPLAAVLLLLLPSMWVAVWAGVIRLLGPYAGARAAARLSGRPRGEFDFGATADPRTPVQRVRRGWAAVLTVLFIVAMAPVVAPTAWLVRALGIEVRD